MPFTWDNEAEIDLQKATADIVDVATVPSHCDLWVQSGRIVIGEYLGVELWIHLIATFTKNNVQHCKRSDSTVDEPDTVMVVDKKDWSKVLYPRAKKTRSVTGSILGPGDTVS